MIHILLIIILLIIITLILVIYRRNLLESLAENRVPISGLPPIKGKLPIKPDMSSNKPLGEYSNELYNQPARVKRERQDILQNKSSSVQPKDMFFDIFNVNCTQPYKRVWSCLLMKGNYVNNLPIENCRHVCPQNFIKQEEEYIPKLEEFKDFIEKEPKPKEYWCPTPCKKTCSPQKYNHLEPWKNTCGQNGFSQVPLNVHLTKEDCMEDAFPCEGKDKDKCLDNSRCGWCINNAGEGICVEGTTEGPLDVTIPCVADRMKATGSYFKGHANPFKGVQQHWK